MQNRLKSKLEQRKLESKSDTDTDGNEDVSN